MIPFLSSGDTVQSSPGVGGQARLRGAFRKAFEAHARFRAREVFKPFDGPYLKKPLWCRFIGIEPGESDSVLSFSRGTSSVQRCIILVRPEHNLSLFDGFHSALSGMRTCNLS